MGDDLNGLPVESIMARVRARAGEAPEGASGGEPASGLPATFEGDLTRNLLTLRARVDVYAAPLVSGRRLLAALFTRAKQLARRLLAPSLGQQVLYNHVNADVVQALKEQCDARAEHEADALAAHLRTFAELERLVGELSRRQARTDAELQRLRAELDRLRAPGGPAAR